MLSGEISIALHIIGIAISNGSFVPISFIDLCYCVYSASWSATNVYVYKKLAESAEQNLLAVLSGSSTTPVGTIDTVL